MVLTSKGEVCCQPILFLQFLKKNQVFQSDVGYRKVFAKSKRYFEETGLLFCCILVFLLTLLWPNDFSGHDSIEWSHFHVCSSHVWTEKTKMHWCQLSFRHMNDRPWELEGQTGRRQKVSVDASLHHAR